MKPKTWTYIMGSGLAAALVGLAVMASIASGLRADLAAAEDRVAEAEEETEEVRDDLQESLEDTEDELADVKKSLQNLRAAPPAPTGNLAEQLANGTATPDDDLSVSLPDDFWTCTQWRGNRCLGLKDEAVFKNDTQIGSAVTCIFDVTYEDGSATTFWWTSDYVPPGGGTDTLVVYFYSDYPSGIDLMGESGDCYRGSAKEGGGGE